MLLTKLLIVFILHTIDNRVKAEDGGIMIKVRPEQIINTFKSVISSEYLKELANDFAVKAANHFIDAIKTKGKQLSIDYRTPPKKIKKFHADHDLLNEREVLTLLQDPAPDGDNLNSLDVSDEEHMVTRKKKIPVIALKKINGVYYRRLLGLI